MQCFSSWLDGVSMIRSRFDRVDAFREQRYDRIRKQLTERKSLFDDAFFPASKQSLGSHAPGVAESVEWKRPTELSGNPKLFDNNELVTAVRRGELSSNWIVSALSILACVKELCYKVVPSYREQEWTTAGDDSPPHPGIFRFRFWRFGRWVEVVVDDSLPVADGKLLFTHSRSPNEFWVSLVEKAYAKLLGSYEALEEGHLADILVDVTGGVSEVIDLKAADYEGNDDSRADLFRMLSDEISDHSIMCASIATYSQDEIGQRTEVGLVRGQAYHVTAVKKIHLGESKIRNLFKGREKVAMVRLRDPQGYSASANSTPDKSVHSNTESEGDYAYSTAQLTRLLSKNPAWAKIKESEKKRIGLSIEHEGEFWMPLEDFVSNLGELTVVRFYNNNIFARGRRWKESALKGCWVADEGSPLRDRSGGGNAGSDTFLRNPQLLFDVEHPECEIVVQMLQWEGKESTTSSPDRQPRHRTLLIGFTIIRVEQNRKYRLHKLWPFYRVAVVMDHQRRRELYYRGHLPKGKYLVVPTTYKPGCEGFFLVRLLSQAEIKLRRLERDVPKSACKLSCVSNEGGLWITIVSVRGAVGIAGVKNVYCSLKCENQRVRSSVARANREIEWDEEFIFYRKHPDRGIVIKVYSRNACTRDALLGWAEIPAAVNHSNAQLEVTLLGKNDEALENTVVRLRVFTEDNILSI